MTRRVVIMPGAERDLDEAFAWYEDQSPGAGVSFLGAASAAFDRIAEFPSAYPIVTAPARRILLRRFPFAAYYLEVGDALVVYAVIHHRRNPDLWKERLGLMS